MIPGANGGNSLVYSYFIRTNKRFIFSTLESKNNYGGRHQKSCTALVVALTLLLQNGPIMGYLLDSRTRCRERKDGTWRSLLGMTRAMSPSNGNYVGYKSEAAPSTVFG